ncbi:MAG: DNA mismatch repair endonuclease MutL [Gemmatimonadaceae bacterium]|jgi:DNA mismatch repair protein MutL|nr:DNA mismatch repair endonuclease MutL [Gemmatimonadaceae bacterium]
MSRIAVLPPVVADQIAAGEVVERPASVIKELVENALDAEARTVTVDVRDGGLVSMRVADDGIGMAPDDALLALSRHATSKIRLAEDLVGVASFGFRGEALPAIASVSRLSLETAVADGEGVRIEVAGGVVERSTPIARRRGTTITVDTLFFNTPARRKFVRGARAEWRAISDVLGAMALQRPDVRVLARHNDVVAIDLPPATSLSARVLALWGREEHERFVEVLDVRGAVLVRGLVEHPHRVGSAARRVIVLVNGRVVREPALVRAAEAAYRTTLSAGERPSMVLDVTVPGETVDVNVHPAKAEVRFRDRYAVERVVEAAVRRALGIEESAGWFATSGERAPALSAPTELTPADLRVSVAAPLPLFEPPRASAPANPDPAAGTVVASDAEGVAPIVDDTPELVVPSLLQLRRTWLMYEREDGVVLIDQHSAHERVLYEQFMRGYEAGTSAGQRLLLPLMLHVSSAEADAFEAHRDLFDRLGFEIDGFGGTTLAVQAVPMPHPRFDAERCLRETLAALAGDRAASQIARHERLAATLACKSAIKAGDDLSVPERRALFVALARCTLPAHDVHGRAAIVRLSWDELERRFGRS